MCCVFMCSCAGVAQAMDSSSVVSSPSRPPLAAVNLMAHRAVETLRWLQPLAKVTRVRSIMCEAASLSPNDLTQPPQQQQDMSTAAATADGSSSSSRFEPVQQQLWQLVQGLVPRLAPQNPRPCRVMGQEGCLARRLLLLLPYVGPNPADRQGLLLTEAVTVLLLMLYDSHFKYDVTMHLLDCYDWLLQLVGDAREEEGEALSAAMDRLTVQLFISETVRKGFVWWSVGFWRGVC